MRTSRPFASVFAFAALVCGLGFAAPDASAQVAGTVVISEFRVRGPGTGNPAEASNEFFEIYNKSDAPINIGGWTLRSVTTANVETTRNTFAVGTTIPARGHYLVVGTGYSLSAYPAGGTDLVPTTATGDDALDSPGIGDEDGIALFSSSTTFDATTRIDSVGFAGITNPLYIEGTGLPSHGTNEGEYSFVRKLVTGTPLDQGDNATDFVFVSTTGGTFGAAASVLGAPGPENLSSPVTRNDLRPSLIDPDVAATAPPNRVRSLTPVVNGSQGTLTIRRKFVNMTGQTITRLRFRVVDITTRAAGVAPPAGTADLRVLDSADGTVTDSDTITPIAVKGTEVETPPAQPLGGGLNSSLAVGTITPATPLAPGNSVNVEFRLGVEQTGTFRFFVNVEAIAAPAAPAAPAELKSLRGVSAVERKK